MPLDHFPEFEATSRQFIETELSLCETLLESAASHRRDPARVTDLLGIIERACQVLATRMADAEGQGWNIAALRQRFTAVQQRLTALQGRGTPQ